MKTQAIMFLVIVPALVVSVCAAIGMAAQPKEQPVEIWLVVDGNAIGTVEPGSFEYDYAGSVIRVSTNELVYGCSQDRIFRDRYQVAP